MTDAPDGPDGSPTEPESEEAWSPLDSDAGASGGDVPGRVLDLDDEPAEEGPPPECAVDGCSRDGVAVRKLKSPGTDEEPTDHYVCRYHYRLFLGIRAMIALAVVFLFALAFFRI